MMHKSKKLVCLLLTLGISTSLMQPTLAAGVTYMPDVTAEMSNASCWAGLYDNAREVILTPEEIETFHEDTCIASGTMVMDLRTAKETFGGKARNEMIRSSSTADARYYFGWTYGPDGEKADWSCYEKRINHCIDPQSQVRDACSVRCCSRTHGAAGVSFENPIWDDPDFNCQYLSVVHVNDPLLIYTTALKPPRAAWTIFSR